MAAELWVQVLIIKNKYRTEERKKKIVCKGDINVRTLKKVIQIVKKLRQYFHIDICHALSLMEKILSQRFTIYGTWKYTYWTGFLSGYYPDFQHAKEGAESALLFCVFAITCTGNTHNCHLRPRIFHRYVLYTRKETLHTRRLDYNWFYSQELLAHFCSEYLVDFSTYLLHRFSASLTP